MTTTTSPPDLPRAHYRLAYRAPICTDCGQDNPWPICDCGLIRRLNDEFLVVGNERPEQGRPARVQFSAYELATVRDGVLGQGREALDEVVVGVMLASFGSWLDHWPDDE